METHQDILCQEDKSDSKNKILWELSCLIFDYKCQFQDDKHGLAYTFHIKLQRLLQIYRFQIPMDKNAQLVVQSLPDSSGQARIAE